MNIAVLQGGRSAERDVSLRSGAQVATALRGRGHEVAQVDLDDMPCLRAHKRRGHGTFDNDRPPVAGSWAATLATSGWRWPGMPIRPFGTKGRGDVGVHRTIAQLLPPDGPTPGACGRGPRGRGQGPRRQRLRDAMGARQGPGGDRGEATHRPADDPVGEDVAARPVGGNLPMERQRELC